MNIKSQGVQCDEIWSFVYAKEKNVEKAVAAPDKAGDAWTWVGTDADTKLVIGWYVSNKDAECADIFMNDIATRLSNKVQFNTDGLKVYLNAAAGSFGNDIDFAQLVKLYGEPEGETSQESTALTNAPGQRKLLSLATLKANTFLPLMLKDKI